jgi:hypothetical protein
MGSGCCSSGTTCSCCSAGPTPIPTPLPTTPAPAPGPAPLPGPVPVDGTTGGGSSLIHWGSHWRLSGGVGNCSGSRVLLPALARGAS